MSAGHWAGLPPAPGSFGTQTLSAASSRGVFSGGDTTEVAIPEFGGTTGRDYSVFLVFNYRRRCLGIRDMNYARFLTATSAARKPSAIRVVSEFWAGAPLPGVGVSRGASKGRAYGPRWVAFIHSTAKAPGEPSSACKPETGTDSRGLGLERKAGNWVSLLECSRSIERERETGCCGTRS